MTTRCPNCGQYRAWYGCRDHGALFAGARAWRRWQRNRRIDREVRRLLPLGGWSQNAQGHFRPGAQRRDVK